MSGSLGLFFLLSLSFCTVVTMCCSHTSYPSSWRSTCRSLSPGPGGQNQSRSQTAASLSERRSPAPDCARETLAERGTRPGSGARGSWTSPSRPRGPSRAASDASPACTPATRDAGRSPPTARSAGSPSSASRTSPCRRDLRPGHCSTHRKASPLPFYCSGTRRRAVFPSARQP
uniref:Putative secreted protein n=1 Tax=Ixodes ricinus TaxID=34613 RepID=A0A6B0UYG7_IXORI